MSDEFHKQYQSLKQKYVALVQQALNEQDSEKQQVLIQQILGYYIHHMGIFNILDHIIMIKT